MVVSVWRKYLQREPDQHIPKFALVWITVIGVLMIGSSIWGFAH